MARKARVVLKPYQCSKCGQKGHNARACPGAQETKAPSKESSKVAKVESSSKEAVKESSKENKETPKKKVHDPEVRLSGSTIDMSAAERPPVVNVKDPGKFRCPCCNQVGVLVVVALPADQNGKSRKVMKCEYCHNKAPAQEILIWGATPDMQLTGA